ncbi:hypothetical protein [Nocardioides seonyuensis]|uniref:hypothetical protein n=1 Tax=Nocardioides seonyuensis TaxID=2518371 RepID=UPI0014222376|nr:hypothetical protein [Nocardioides seonyuensis]
MSTSRTIEHEQGTYVPRPRHLHNGYYAGDFRHARPTSPETLQMIMDMHRPPWTPPL